MGQRMFCEQQSHPGSDQEADQWCERYHQDHHLTFYVNAMSTTERKRADALP